jgi:prophage regulatory protein
MKHQTINNQYAGDDAMLRINQVAALTSLSPSTIYREVKKATFPRPFQLTEKTVAWKMGELKSWLSSRKTVGSQGCRPEGSVSEDRSA